MFGRHVLQREVRLTIIFLLLLLSNPTPSRANKMNQLPKLPQIVPPNGAVSKRVASNNKIDIHRLYNAYRDRIKDGGEDVKHGTGLVGENPAVAEEEDMDSLGRSLKAEPGGSVAERSEKTSLLGREDSKVDSRKKPLLMPSPDDRNVGELKCVPKQKSKDVDEEKNGKESSDIKEPEVKGMVILQMDLPTKDKIEGSTAAGKSMNSQDSQDAAERRIAELNRVYKEFISAWKKPSTDGKRPNLFVSKPVRLNALNELMNVVENLRRPNTMDDFVKAINDEMTEREGLVSPDKLSDNIVRTNPLKIERATGIFKRMSGNDVDSGEVKTGGLYEQYKKKLNEILKAQRNPGKSLGKDLSDISPCHCDAKKPLTLTVDSEGNRISSGQSQCHCDASRFALEGGDPTKLSNGVVQCHCDDVKDAKLVDHKPEKATDYFEALEACMKVHKEKTVNGGPKPYYISNSKQRQMVWNEIPLMRTGEEKATKMVVCKGKPKISAGSQDNRQVTDRANSPEAKAKLEQSICNALQKNGTHLTKNQKQLIHLLKVLQAKHRSHKRGLTDTTDRNGNQLGNVGFPQVLVQQVGAGTGAGSQAGNRVIDNMAKQLNVSPMEMAQRIAASSSSASSSSNAALNYPLQSNSASQTIGYQVPANHNKIAPETPNVAPMLEKILNRLQTMQDTNFNRGVEMGAADRLPCCFAEPTDGAPCEITGSWESLLLGVRIHIVDEHRLVKESPKPVCAQPQPRDYSRSWRQCVKLTPKELKERFKAGEIKSLNITIEETVPPRPHEMLENINDWIFTGQAVSTLGGPISFSCRKLDSKLMGTFIGYCRNCGCIDTIFGSWTFCHPSKDCQDITMSIFERRDVLRRYSLPEVRRERIKDQLYTRSKFAKLEKQQQDEHPTLRPHSE